MTNENPTYLTCKEVATRFHISESALASWRMKKQGLPYLKLMGKILYKLEDVVKFEKENVNNPQS